MPPAEEYEIIEKSPQIEIKIGFGTYPAIGNMHGADKYYWYDFYVIEGSTLILNNEKHTEFYREITGRYKQRIDEINHEIRLLKRDTVKGNEKESKDAFMIGIKRDHIKRYQEFIKKAEKIYMR